MVVLAYLYLRVNLLLLGLEEGRDVLQLDVQDDLHLHVLQVAHDQVRFVLQHEAK